MSKRTFKGFRNFRQNFSPNYCLECGEHIIDDGHRATCSFAPERTGGKDTHCSICGNAMLGAELHKDFCLKRERHSETPKIQGSSLHGPALREKTLQPGEADENGVAHQGESRTIYFELDEDIHKLINDLDRRIRVLEHEYRIRSWTGR